MTGPNTRLPALMIDAPTTTDRDDAITVTPAADGGWGVVVHVANVADLVAVGSAVDRAAAAMVETRYRARGTTPMLGDALEQSATLSEHRDRDAVAIGLCITADGEATLTGIGREQLPVGSCVALTHDDVTRALVDAGHPHHAQLTQASAVARVLTARRRDAGAFVVYDLTRGLVSTEDGRLVQLPAGHNAAAYVIVQEAMIAANVAVAQYAIEVGLPILFRNHRRNAVAPADADRLTILAGALSTVTTTAELAALQGQLNMAVSRATYAPVVHGHTGLQVAAYTHATSPLRRYADLVTQRQLLAHLDHTGVPYTSEQLAIIGEALTTITTERARESEAAQKARTRRVTAAAIADGDYRHMTDRAFLRVLRVGTEAAPPASVVAELSTRAEAGRLHAGHVAVLFATDQPDWVTVRDALTDQLRTTQAHLAPSVIGAWQQIGDGEIIAPAFDTEPSGPPHQRVFATRAQMSTVTGQVHTRWHTGPVKKATEHAALWDLLDTLSGRTAPADPTAPPPQPQTNPSTTQATPTPPPGAAPTVFTVAVDTAAPAAPPSPAHDSTTTSAAAAASGWDTAALHTALGGDDPTTRIRKRTKALANPVGWLTTLAATIGADPMAVDTHTEGPPHQPVFTVTVTVGPASGSATASTSKGAKVEAAQKAITGLFDQK